MTTAARRAPRKPAAKVSGFDRIPMRSAEAQAEPLRTAADVQPDQEGRQLLFSPVEHRPAFGSVTVDCSGCSVRTSVSPGQAVALAIPSIHVPLPGKRYPSWMRCPACGRRTWVRLGVHL
jgi:hypothetical protein